MSNFNNVNVPNPPSNLSSDSDPQQLEELRDRLKRNSQARFEELVKKDMLPREE